MAMTGDGNSEVRKFASILYPACLAPVEFTDYAQVATKDESQTG